MVPDAFLVAVAVGDPFIQERVVPGFFEIVYGHKWEPQEVVGVKATATDLGDRMPPVVNVTVYVLMRSMKLDLFCSVGWINGEEYLAVLKLITEPIRAA